MNDNEKTRRFNKARREQLRAGLRIRKDTYRAIADLLREAEASITAALAASPSEYQLFYLTRLQTEIRQTLARVAQASARRMGDAADASWQAGLDLVDKPLAAGGVQVAGLVPHISTDQLLAMRTFMVDKIKDVSTALANQIVSELGMTLTGVQTVGDTITRVQRLFATQGRSRALTIVRTELGRAYGVATYQRMRGAAQRLPGLKKQWRRSGKIHSRLAHDAIDGQIREVDEPFTLGNGAQLQHPRDPAAPIGEVVNCGCESLPYMESWDVQFPARRPYSEAEKRLDARKAEQAALAAS